MKLEFKTRENATCIESIVSQYRVFGKYHNARIDEYMIRQFLTLSLPMVSHISDDNESDYIVCVWEVEYVYRKNRVTATVTVVWNPVFGACVSRVQCKYWGTKASLYERISGTERRLMKITEKGVIEPYSRKVKR